MACAEKKDFAQPDKVSNLPKGKSELVNIGGGVVSRVTLEPGWHWSEHVKPFANSDWCDSPHFMYQISGRLHFVMSDGTEIDSEPGQVTALSVSHDAWVVGDEPVVIIDWAGASNYAKK